MHRHVAHGSFSFVARLVLAILGAGVFAALAFDVRAGGTLAFDDTVLRWMGHHQLPILLKASLEITALGTGAVVIMLSIIVALFLALGTHRAMALLLLIAVAGGLIINGALKYLFHRPRPHIFAWGTQVTSTSFPSGHAMNSVVAYLIIAYLASRLEPRAWMRWLTVLVAILIIILIDLSRLYLGVHYPSDVIAGLILGLAWIGLCTSGFDAAQRARLRSRPPERRQEHDPGRG